MDYIVMQFTKYMNYVKLMLFSAPLKKLIKNGHVLTMFFEVKARYTTVLNHALSLYNNYGSFYIAKNLTVAL